MCMYTQDPTSQPDTDAEPRLQMDDVTPEQAVASQARLQVHASVPAQCRRLASASTPIPRT